MHPTALHPRLQFQAEVGPHVPRLRARALRLCRDPDEAGDLVQETVLRAWRFWPRYQHGTNLGAWLQRILRNTFINGYRRARRERELMRQVRVTEDAKRDPSFEADAVRRSLSDEVQASMDALAPEFRAVVWLVDVRGCSYREAAERLGCPLGTVMSRLHRGRRLLARELRTYAEAEGYLAA